MKAFLASLIFLVLAEMGDKTQLLAMAFFACRFRWQVVMWGVFVATAANHPMAAALGSYQAAIVPIQGRHHAWLGSEVPLQSLLDRNRRISYSRDGRQDTVRYYCALSWV